MTVTEKTNLFGLDRAGMRAFFADRGEKPFRADQVMQWIYRQGSDDFDAMTNLAKSLRAWLPEVAEIRVPELVAEQVSRDGTTKWLLRLDGGNSVEIVFIPEPGRGTLCISSQVGCAMDCSFCSTGKQGLNRNMTTAEIVSQVWFAARALEEGSEPRTVTNVVFMGMGEPLANFGNLVPALNVLLDPLGFGLSRRRVTVSTSGLVPFMDRLRTCCDVALAVSLHAPDDHLRDQLVPINRKYPIRELLAACRRYTAGREHKAHVTYEYVMLDQVNDTPAHARALARLLRDMPAKVNLIPFNPFPGTDYRRSPAKAIARFQEILIEAGLLTIIRRTRGDDIDAACGQLVGRVQDRQRRHFREIPIRSVRV